MTTPLLWRCSHCATACSYTCCFTGFSLSRFSLMTSIACFFIWPGRCSITCKANEQGAETCERIRCPPHDAVVTLRMRRRVGRRSYRQDRKVETCFVGLRCWSVDDDGKLGRGKGQHLQAELHRLANHDVLAADLVARRSDPDLPCQHGGVRVDAELLQLSTYLNVRQPTKGQRKVNERSTKGQRKVGPTGGALDAQASGAARHQTNGTGAPRLQP